MILFLTNFTAQVNYTHFGKALKKSDQSLGITQACYFMAASISIIIIDSLGGNLYEKSPPLPFLICLTMWSLLLLLMLVYAIMGHLHI
jgi:hypothetical protein